MTEEHQKVLTWAMLCHLSSLLGFLISICLGLFGIPLPIPFLNVIGPLVVWLSKKNLDPRIDSHGKESLNFQLSLTLYSIILGILLLFLIAATCGVALTPASNNKSLEAAFGVILGAGIVVGAIIAIFQIFLVIFAAIKARKGEFYHYPLTIHFLQ